MLCECRRFFLLFISGFYFISNSALLAFWLISDKFTGEGINEATLFHFNIGLRGLTGDFLSKPIIVFGLVLFLFTIFLCVSFIRTASRKKYSGCFKKPMNWVFYLFAVIGFCFNPAVGQISKQIFYSYNQESFSKDLAELKRPGRPNAKIEGVKSNVLIIYLEGVENSFFDEDVFPGLTPNINKIRGKALDFRGVRQVPFTGWTIAGQVASQCGVVVGNNDEYLEAEGKLCLGDLLHNSGYNLVYMNGSHLDFGNKGDFWTNHQYRAYGYEDIPRIAKAKNYSMSEWGAYDDTLVQSGQNMLDQLYKEDRPFALTMLTVDTHAVRGYKTPSCNHLPRYKKNEPLLDAVRCTDFLIGGWLNKVMNEHPDLTIVLLSDHLQPLSVNIKGISRNIQERENLFLVWSPRLSPKTYYREATTFDIYPTVSEILGADMPEIGLGRSLINERPTIMEDLGYERFSLLINSSYMMRIK